jgi:hypothetical protein
MVPRARRLRDIVTRSGIRIVGSSSLGGGFAFQRFSYANAAFAETDIPQAHFCRVA